VAALVLQQKALDLEGPPTLGTVVGLPLHVNALMDLQLGHPQEGQATLITGVSFTEDFNRSRRGEGSSPFL